MDDIILTMKGIDKSFPGVRALAQAEFEVRCGEVHALTFPRVCGGDIKLRI